MDKCADGDLLERKSVSELGSCLGTAHQNLSDLKAVGSDDIGLGAVSIVEKRDACRAVGILFDALYNCGYTVVCSFKVDETQFSLMTASTIAG